MKYVLVILEGAAGRACAELEGMSPLEVARCPTVSALAREGGSGWLDWEDLDVPLTAESGLGLLLGLPEGDVRLIRRGPVEAAVVEGMRGAAFVYRVNFVTVTDGVVQDNRVANLNEQETIALCERLNERFGEEGVRFAPLGPGRAVAATDRLPDHPDEGECPRVGMRFPETGGSRVHWMKAAGEVLESDAINEVRVDLGENPANRIWLWGGGVPSPVRRAFLGAPLRARMVSNHPLGEGLAQLCGMEHERLGDLWMHVSKPLVPDRDRWRSFLADRELLVVSIEAPLEGSGYGTPLDHGRCLDRIDIHVLRPLLEAVRTMSDPVRGMIVCAPGDRELDADAYPALLWGSGAGRDRLTEWDEKTCRGGGLGAIQPTRVIARLLGD
ncbi:MAG TPA: hypothetical protein PKE55_10165 [Kiritimatiellia bacterium]|nr:hypothetical protein [Kiritimatiellia bacterium]